MICKVILDAECEFRFDTASWGYDTYEEAKRALPDFQQKEPDEQFAILELHDEFVVGDMRLRANLTVD